MEALILGIKVDLARAASEQHQAHYRQCVHHYVHGQCGRPTVNQAFAHYDLAQRGFEFANRQYVDSVLAL